jgi:hypothetical protein
MDPSLLQTRRHFFERCGIGVGKMALASLLTDRIHGAGGALPGFHHPPKVKSVIFLFMAGGPSQFELFDYKPKLQQLDSQVAPESLLKGKRFAFMDTFAKEPPKLLGTRRQFKQYGQSGAWVSECFPKIATVVDELTFLRGVSTENFNHAPAKIFVNTGSTRFGRPSMGAWITYGLGSESHNLPGFVVMLSGPRGPRGGALNWSSGFLPTAHQGVVLRSSGDPILDLSSPRGITTEQQQQAIELIRDLNQIRLNVTGDPEIATRIASYEMAFRMQTSGPELIDLAKESPATLRLYGIDGSENAFARNCLLARRLVERGVRFVQLYHTDWDHHADLGKPLDEVVREVDRPIAALIRDLKGRGLLESTLVVWSGEFGRTPMGEVRENGKVGRNHHIDAFTIWMAGGGLKPGISYGGTDELGFSPQVQMDVHDVQATILHLLGIDHTRLTFKFQGRPFRLTDVGGRVLKEILA